MTTDQVIQATDFDFCSFNQMPSQPIDYACLCKVDTALLLCLTNSCATDTANIRIRTFTKNANCQAAQVSSNSTPTAISSINSSSIGASHTVHSSFSAGAGPTLPITVATSAITTVSTKSGAVELSALAREAVFAIVLSCLFLI
jgi:hypothetical protein